MTEERREFDFAAWLAAKTSESSFRDCIRSAANHLALDNDDLRGRLVSAVFSLSFCSEQSIPDSFRSDFEAICQVIKQRVGDGDDNFRLRHADYDRLRKWARKCKLRTARQIAEKIIAMDRALIARMA